MSRNLYKALMIGVSLQCCFAIFADPAIAQNAPTAINCSAGLPKVPLANFPSLAPADSRFAPRNLGTFSPDYGPLCTIAGNIWRANNAKSISIEISPDGSVFHWGTWTDKGASRYGFTYVKAPNSQNWKTVVRHPSESNPEYTAEENAFISDSGQLVFSSPRSRFIYTISSDNNALRIEEQRFTDKWQLASVKDFEKSVAKAIDTSWGGVARLIERSFKLNSSTENNVHGDYVSYDWLELNKSVIERTFNSSGQTIREKVIEKSSQPGEFTAKYVIGARPIVENLKLNGNDGWRLLSQNGKFGEDVQIKDGQISKSFIEIKNGTARVEVTENYNFISPARIASVFNFAEKERQRNNIYARRQAVIDQREREERSRQNWALVGAIVGAGVQMYVDDQNQKTLQAQEQASTAAWQSCLKQMGRHGGCASGSFAGNYGTAPYNPNNYNNFPSSQESKNSSASNNTGGSNSNNQSSNQSANNNLDAYNPAANSSTNGTGTVQSASNNSSNQGTSQNRNNSSSNNQGLSLIIEERPEPKSSLTAEQIENNRRNEAEYAEKVAYAKRANDEMAARLARLEAEKAKKSTPCAVRGCVSPR